MDNPLVNKIIMIIVGTIAGLLLIMASLWLINLLMPFIIGFIIATIANPIVKLFRGVKIPRSFASIISVIIVLSIILGAVYFFGSFVSGQVTRLGSTFQDLGEKAEQLFRDSYDGLALKYPHILKDDFDVFINKVSPNLGKLLTDGLVPIGGKLFDFAKTLPGTAFYILISIISSFFISIEYERIRSWIRARFKKNPFLGSIIRKLKRSAGYGVGSWVKAQLIVMCAIAIVTSIGFLLLGYNHWLLIGIVIAFFDALPVLGAGMALAPLILYNAIYGKWVVAFWHFVLYLCLVVTRQSIEPRVLGHQIGVNPLFTLLAVYVGFRLWGIAGVFASIILLVIVMSLMPKKQLPTEKEEVSS